MELNLCVNCMEETTGGVCPHCGFDPSREKAVPNVLEWNTILHGRYLVGKMLGQGGFGITYIGFDLPLNTKVAVKEYFPLGHVTRNFSYSNKLQWDASMASREQWKNGCENFLREARRMAKIDEIPEIVRVRDTFTENNTAYIVMDYVKGVTMKDAIMQRGPMKMKDCLDLLEPLARALDQVHRKGMIHRDISPDNIMILPNGKVKLLDFGAAKDFTLGGNERSQLVAKKGFSPVEQYVEGGNIGPWTDVYAMTATIYYAVTGKRVPESLERVNRDTLVMKPNPQYGLTKKVIDVLQAGLALKAKARIQSIAELFGRLREASTGKSSMVVNTFAKVALFSCAGVGIFMIVAILVGIWLLRDTTKTWTEDGITYEGHQAGGKIDGKGKATYEDGSWYEGEFDKGIREGEGTLHYPDDDEIDRIMYDGEWLDDEKNGTGTMTWSTGNRYEGEWKDDVRNGNGKFFWEDGDWYDGDWVDDKRQGTGTIYWTDGSRYEGEWKDNLQDGTGTYYYPEDDEKGRSKYVGEWKEGDNADGQGVLYFNDGTSRMGTWKDNRLQE